MRTILFAILFALLSMTGVNAESETIAVRAGRLHIGDGQVRENVTVLIDDGKIRAIGGADLPVPDGARIVECAEGSITPGLIDANARIEPRDIVSRGSGRSSQRTPEEVVLDLFGARPKPNEDLFHLTPKELDILLHGPSSDEPVACEHAADAAECYDPHCRIHYSIGDGSGGKSHCPLCGGFSTPLKLASGLADDRALAEQSAEIIPHTAVLDTLDLGSPDFQRLMRNGVTTVYASPDSSAVIGPRGAIVHTGGAVERRVLQAKAAVKAVMGSDPTYVGTFNRPARGGRVTQFTRRPTTRMGVTWVFRKAFFDTMLRMDGRPASGGADTPSLAASDALAQVIEGEVPLRIQARALHDIATAFRLADEANLTFVLEEATDAWRCLPELKKRGLPVVFGPIYDEAPGGPRSWSGETRWSRLNTLSQLVDAGITTALSAQELRDESGLARQAMCAMRYGLSLEEALATVTSVPARILGLEDELGTVEAGKRADLILWSGRPFAATSKPLVILIDGEVVFDDRS